MGGKRGFVGAAWTAVRVGVGSVGRKKAENAAAGQFVAAGLVQTARQAAVWVRAGFTSTTAAPWIHREFSAEDARLWRTCFQFSDAASFRDARFTAEDASTWNAAG